MKMRRKEKIILITALAGVVGSGIWLLYAWLYLWPEKAIERELAKIRAKGEPVTLEELAPPEIPDAQNAALLYEKAYTLHQMERGEWRKLDEITGKDLDKWSEEDIKIMRDYIEKNQDSLRLIHKAMDYEKCRFPLDYSAAPIIEFPHLSKMRELARFLARDALLKAKEGKIDDALESIGAGLHIGKALSSDPLLIPQYGRHATDGLALSALERVLNENGGERATSQRLLKELDIQLRRQAFIKCMKGQVCTAMEDFDACVKDPSIIGEIQDVYRNWSFGVAGGNVQGTEVPIGRLGFLARPLIRRDEIFCLKASQQSAEASKLPYYRVKNRLKKLEEETKKTPFYCVITKMTFFNITSQHLFQARNEARIGLAQLALALKILKAEKGKYPDTLAELVPEILPELPQDPFTGKDFVYKREGEGFLVYSLNENARDDGGIEGMPSEYDIPWHSQR